MSTYFQGHSSLYPSQEPAAKAPAPRAPKPRRVVTPAPLDVAAPMDILSVDVAHEVGVLSTKSSGASATVPALPPPCSDGARRSRRRRQSPHGC